MAPRRSQLSARVVTVALALFLPALAACGDDGTIDDPDLPYSFSYPHEFESGGESTRSSREKGYDNQTIVAKADGQDLVAVQTQPLRRPVTPDLISRLKREVEQSARRTGRVRARKPVRVDGLDGVSFEMALRGDTGVPVGARWIYAAKDRTLFWINCQWQRDRPAVLEACDEVTRTFEVR